MSQELNIRRNDPQDFRAFVELNMEWIREFHDVEASDQAMYDFPERYAEDGNSIFAAVEGERVLGVCALKRDEEGGWELTKMAVDRECRGRGIGERLMEVVEGYARDELGVERIYLISNTVHAAAIRLYKRCGWVVTFEGPHPRYARGNIGMDKVL